MPSYVSYCLGIIVVQLASQYSCMRYTSDEKFRNLAVTTGYVYIGGENNIIHLNSTLDVYDKRTITHYPVNWLLTVHNNKNLIACNYKKDSSYYKLICLNFDVGPKMINRTQKIGLKTKSPSAKYITTTFSDESQKYEVLVIATSSCFTYSGETKCTAISGSLFMDYSTPFVEYPKEAMLYSVRYLDNSKHVNFTTVLQQDKYIYFLFNPNDTQSKLGKLCTARNSYSSMNSFEDTPIKCTHNTTVFTNAQDAVFWKDYLFVAFTDDYSSAICRYKLTDIETQFKESRQERLKCPYVPFKNSFFEREQKDFKWCYNKTLEKCEATGKDNPITCEELTGDFCNTNLFESVEGNSFITQDNVVYSEDSSVNGAVEKLGVLSFLNHAVIYAGTKKGRIGKILHFADDHSVKQKCQYWADVLCFASGLHEDGAWTPLLSSYTYHIWFSSLHSG